jgi:hypothetical protein
MKNVISMAIAVQILMQLVSKPKLVSGTLVSKFAEDSAPKKEWQVCKNSLKDG